MELATKYLFELIATFILGGGLGYVNYFILHNMDVVVITNDDKEEKVFLMIICSIINIVLFHTVCSLFENTNLPKEWNYIISVVLTLIITIILSFTIFKRIIKWMYNIINIYRAKDGLAKVDNKSVKSLVFDRNKPQYAYVYDLRTDKLLAYGILGWWDEKKNGDLEFEIEPHEFAEKWEYPVAMKRALKNDDASIYINVEKQLKIIVIEAEPEAPEELKPPK